MLWIFWNCVQIEHRRISLFVDVYSVRMRANPLMFTTSFCTQFYYYRYLECISFSLTHRGAEKAHFRFSIVYNKRLLKGVEREHPFHSITRLFLQVTSRTRRSGTLSRCLACSCAATKSVDLVPVGVCLMRIKVVLVFCGARGQMCTIATVVVRAWQNLQGCISATRCHIEMQG